MASSRDNALVLAQTAALSALAWPGRPKWQLPRPVAFAAAGLVALGAGAVAAGARALGPDLAVRPTPRDSARLHREGPYTVVRHPIYGGLLVGGAGVALLRRRPEPLAALAALAGVLHVKAGYEERLLRDRYGAAYEAYAQRVPRLLPDPRRWVRRA